MVVFGGKFLLYLGFSFLACIILQFLNYARQLVKVQETPQVTASSDSLVHGICIICHNSINFSCGWWKSAQYCSPKCKLIHWREERRKEHQILNESVIVANGLEPHQTSHTHGNKTKKCATLVGKSEKQSSTEDGAPSSFFSQVSKQDGPSISKSAPENNTDSTRGLGKSKKVNNSLVKVTGSKFQSSTDQDSTLNESMELWLFGKPLNIWNNHIRNFVQVYDEAKSAFKEVSQVKFKAKLVSQDKLTPDLLVKEAKMEAPAEPEEPSLRDETLPHNCATCYAPTKTRCSRCKSIYYCSGKCQIRHWRSGHQEQCKPLSKPTSAASRAESLVQKSDSNATIKENLQNLDGTVSKIIQQNCDESTEVLRKNYKQTICNVKMVSSNPEANTGTDFEMGMLNREGSKTKKVEEQFTKRSPFRGTTWTDTPSFSMEKSFYALKEQKDQIIMQKTENKSSQEINRLKQEIEKKCTKLQDLEKIQTTVLKENQVHKTMQIDVAKGLEHLCQEKEENVSKDSDNTNCMKFSYVELREATSNFDKALKIGEGGYGSVYKGVLYCTTVAIKVLRRGRDKDERAFYKEVEVLRKIRHPNIVTLIGECSQIKALVYEFLPNGSLENYLSSCAHRKLLYWKTRIMIASNICSALIFLHSTKPHGIVHGDVKPANILLDSNYQGKLSDFGTSCQLMKTHDTITPQNLAGHPKGTSAYLDPEYIQTGEITVQSDVYSFGIILLQLVTRKPDTGICKSVQEALKIQGLSYEIDVSAKWPPEKAIKMVMLGLRCCNPTRKNRPNLATEVWSEIESLKQDASRKSAVATGYFHGVHQFILPDFSKHLKFRLLHNLL